jgi:signal transduction histidine kinase
LFERRRRVAAELEARNRLLENIRLNRVAILEASSRSIAHQIRQPLTAILSNAQTASFLLEANPPKIAPLKEILADIIADNRRADEVITHLRQLPQGQAAIKHQEFDLNEAIQGALRILASESLNNRVELNTNLDQAVPRVRGDPVHVQQVILNLAVNAMEAMADCGPDRRRLSFRTSLIGASEVMVSVSDTGPGIPEDQVERIFESFVTTKTLGTGLGLSIARTIIETHGGKLWAENRSDGGAVFRFILPLADARPSPQAPTARVHEVTAAING